MSPDLVIIVYVNGFGMVRIIVDNYNDCTCRLPAQDIAAAYADGKEHSIVFVGSTLDDLYHEIRKHIKTTKYYDYSTKQFE